MKKSRLPAEWEPHRACWLAWPHLADEWPGHFEGARDEIAGLAQQIATLGREHVHLLVASPEDRALLEQRLRAEMSAKRITLDESIAFGDAWTRDTLPFFSLREGKLVAQVFGFDGWGGKYLMPGDGELGAVVASRLGVETHQSPLWVEGGALEVNGSGLGLTTEHSLFVRNAERTRAEVDSTLSEALNLEKLVCLRGALENDHTDGHIDTLARFVSPHVVVVMRPAKDDPNEAVMTSIHEQLVRASEDRGLDLRIEELPSAGAVYSDEGELLPASYLNFYIANEAVLMPAYGVATDEDARLALQAHFPTRPVYASPARHLITGGGAVHCCTHQEPLAEESR